VSAATLAALAAGVAAAVAVADLGGAWGERRRRPGRWRRIGLRALARLGRGAATRAPRDLHERIARAGLAAKPGDVMAVKAAAALVVAVAAAPLISVLPGRLGPVLCAAVAGATFLLPDLWLRRRTRARARAMDAELPGVLDLLRVAIAAGLPPSRALGEVGRRHPGVLAGELRHTAAARPTPSHRSSRHSRARRSSAPRPRQASPPRPPRRARRPPAAPPRTPPARPRRSSS